MAFGSVLPQIDPLFGVAFTLPSRADCCSALLDFRSLAILPTVFYIPDSASFPASGSQALKTWARRVVFGFPVSLDRTLTHLLPPTTTQNSWLLQSLSFDGPLKCMSLFECSQLSQHMAVFTPTIQNTFFSYPDNLPYQLFMFDLSAHMRPVY